MVPLPVDRISDYAVRPEVLDRIRAGHEAILAEMRPTPAQLAEGLELHYDSYVGDVQGSVQTSFPHGLVGERAWGEARFTSLCAGGDFRNRGDHDRVLARADVGRDVVEYVAGDEGHPDRVIYSGNGVCEA